MARHPLMFYRNNILLSTSFLTNFWSIPFFSPLKLTRSYINNVKCFDDALVFAFEKIILQKMVMGDEASIDLPTINVLGNYKFL